MVAESLEMRAGRSSAAESFADRFMVLRVSSDGGIVECIEDAKNKQVLNPEALSWVPSSYSDGRR